MLKLRTVGLCLGFVSLINLAACLPPDEQKSATPTATPVPTVVPPVVPVAQVTTYIRACDASTPAGQCDLDNPKIKALVDACKASGQVAELCESREKVAEFKLQAGAAPGNTNSAGCSPMYVNSSDGLKVRSEAKADSTDMGGLDSGAEIIPTGKQGDWVSHSYNGTTGWTIQKLNGKDTLTCSKPAANAGGGGGNTGSGEKPAEFGCGEDVHEKKCFINSTNIPGVKVNCHDKNDKFYTSFDGGLEVKALWKNCILKGKGEEYVLIAAGGIQCYVLKRDLNAGSFNTPCP